MIKNTKELVGTKFRHEYDYNEKYIYTIGNVEGDDITIMWGENGKENFTTYSLHNVKRYLNDGTWVKTST